MRGSGRTVSAWMRDAELEVTEELRESTSTQVCVVGAGIAGLTTAYLLCRAGMSVVVLDDGEIGGGETSRTTAHLATAIDDRFTAVERVRGKEVARLAAESHVAAIDRIEAIASEEHIDCDFSRLDGYLFAAPEQPPGMLEEELAAARRAGLAVELMQSAPLDGYHTGPCLRFPRQGQLQPLRYLSGLRQAVQRYGGRIYTRTHAHEIQGGRSAAIRTHGGLLVAASQAIVVATNTPVNDRIAIHTKLYPYRTFVISARVPRDSVPRALYWDTAEPYHYVRSLSPRLVGGEDEHDLLLVGGEDHKTGHADDAPDRYRRLEQWARERFPAMQEVRDRWSGQVMETLDGLAYIGRNPLDADNVYIAAGDSGMGMTHGTIAGILLSDLIRGRENPWVAVYNPSRKPVGAVREFLSENLDVARQYLDWIAGSEVTSPEQLPRGAGAVMRRGTSRIAMHRDDDGNLHRLSAKCTHLQCVVQWNSEERTWDCPCHGSRFTIDGEVVNGPTNYPLERVKG